MSDYIPEDNLVQILKNLPVKSLLRFRSVSKRWKHLIDSPSFLQEHLSVQNPRILISKINVRELLVVDPHTLCTLPVGHKLRFPDFPQRDGPISYLGNRGRYLLCGALHGIVCLYDYGRDLLLWNPTIRKFSVLPLPDIIPNFPWEFSWLHRSCVGFWTDPSNTEFKFISFNLISVLVKLKQMGVAGVLYSSIRHDWRVILLGEEGKWKPLQQPPTKTVGRLGNWSSGIESCPPIMIGRVAYWRGGYWLENEQGHQHESVEVIVSFDFVQESFEFLETPIVLDSHRYILFQSQGTLSLLFYGFRNETESHWFEIYSRQGDSWVHMFASDFSFPLHFVYWVFGETEDNFRVFADTGDELVLYDTRAGCIPFKVEYSIAKMTCVGDDFVESLLLLPTSVNPSITR